MVHRSSTQHLSSYMSVIGINHWYPYFLLLHPPYPSFPPSSTSLPLSLSLDSLSSLLPPLAYAVCTCSCSFKGTFTLTSTMGGNKVELKGTQLAGKIQILPGA